MRRLRRHSPAKALRKAFTLLELLIVLAIIVAIAAMVAPNLISSQQDANEQIARTTIKNIEDAFKRKAVKNNGVFDSTSGPDAISALAEPWEDNLGKQQAPLLDDIPIDPWGNEFQYSYSDGDLKPMIWSSGPNGQDDGGSGDDISNKRREDS